ncbi:SPFH domain-containing protein [Nonomuraea wenchangensis]|uniref:SPFH domain-containing protein n=1 Tax=Nonomuraea wenchangensis TaxID=568860 RepID=UPI0033DC0E85
MRAESSFGRRLLAALARVDDAGAPPAQARPAAEGSFGRRLLGALARRDPEPLDVTVPIGMTGVVVASGGVLPDALPGGSAYPRDSADVVLIPARDLSLRWADDHGPDDYDAALEPLVVGVQGFRLRIELAVVLRIPAETAPTLVGDFGDDAPVQRFVERVLDPVVRARFVENGTLEEFLIGYERLRADLTATLTEALAARGVRLQAVVMGAADPGDPAVVNALRQIAAAEIEGRALAIVADEEIRLMDTTAGPDKSLRLEYLVLQNKIELLDAGAARKLLQGLGGLRVPEYVSGGDVRSLLETIPLGTARELLERVLRETAAERAQPEDDH